MSKQDFKSVYFLDEEKSEPRGRSVTISFSEEEHDLKDRIDALTNEEIRELVGVTSYPALLAQSKDDGRTISQFVKIKLWKNINKLSEIKNADVTFQNSKKTLKNRKCNIF